MQSITISTYPRDTPGNYALFCFIPNAKDGKPHVAHGMIKPFTVR